MALASVSVMAESHTLYVDNQSGHEAINIYAWAEGEAELFGGWPGASSTGLENIGGTEYLTYELPASDVAYNLIISWENGGDGKQYDGPSIVPNKDIFLKVGAESAEIITNQTPVPNHTLYVDNQTGHDVINMYAWAIDAPELFGGWPGASSNGSENIAGTEYLTYELPASDAAYNLIISWENGGNGKQYDGPSIVPNKDIFLKAEANSATVISDPRVQTFNFHVEDKTGWGTLYLYAHANGGDSIFGTWPGTQASLTTTINGTTYKVFPFEESAASVNLIFNNNNGTQFDGPAVTLDKDYYFVVTATSCEEKTDVSTVITSIDEDDNDTPIYYTTTGIRVKNPSNGIYIVVKGNKTTKVTI